MKQPQAIEIFKTNEIFETIEIEGNFFNKK